VSDGTPEALAEGVWLLNKSEESSTNSTAPLYPLNNNSLFKK
jgi:hypothetical protein